VGWDGMGLAAAADPKLERAREGRRKKNSDAEA
jgi:hypothetical protein